LARQKRLNLLLDIESSISCDVLVDALRFKQILSNLVSNAIKFTEEGTIKVSIAGALSDDNLLNVSLRVEDTGVGISAADQARLFRPFVQAQRNVQSGEGTGLGLVICRSLCEMMGGWVGMSSELGRGTCVNVELRLQVLERINAPRLATIAQPQHRYRLQVLVVDDHQVNRQVLRQQLAFLGHDVIEAADGESALALWREQAFDVVITDCHMPGMSGVALTQAIRQIETEEIELGIQAGMNECLIKPIGLDELDARLIAYQHSHACEVDAPLPVVERLSAVSEAARLLDLGPLELLISSEPVKFRQILNELINNNRKDRQRLGALLQAADTDRLVELAHRIKGAARVVKGEQLVQRCRALEVACADPQVSVIALEASVAGLNAP